jgi:hypothetical protein
VAEKDERMRKLLLAAVAVVVLFGNVHAERTLSITCHGKLNILDGYTHIFEDVTAGHHCFVVGKNDQRKVLEICRKGVCTVTGNQIQCPAKYAEDADRFDCIENVRDIRCVK